MSESFSANGWVCAPPIDALAFPAFNLLCPRFLAIVVGLILECLFMAVGLSPPYNCITDESLALCRAVSIVVGACSRAGCHTFLIIPDSAVEWLTFRHTEFPPCLSVSATLDACMFGSPYCLKWRISSSYSLDRHCNKSSCPAVHPHRGPDGGTCVFGPK